MTFSSVSGADRVVAATETGVVVFPCAAWAVVRLVDSFVIGVVVDVGVTTVAVAAIVVVGVGVLITETLSACFCETCFSGRLTL